jgi:hypothetical protein
MPAKRGIATDDRNWVAAHLVELAFGRAKTHFPLIILSLRAFWQLNGLLNAKTCKPRNLRKEWDKDKLIQLLRSSAERPDSLGYSTEGENAFFQRIVRIASRNVTGRSRRAEESRS